MKKKINSAFRPGKVSVIIPFYNQEEYIEASVASALMATKYEIEVIIVDDGSDSTSASLLARDLADTDDRIIYYYQTNTGLPAARNTGLSISDGEFIQFLDADDLLVPTKIDWQIAHLNLNQAIDISVGDYLLCDKLGVNLRTESDSIRGSSFALEEFLYKWERGLSIPIHCALFRRKCFADVVFNEELKAKEDWDFWVNLALFRHLIGYVPRHDAIYRIHGNNMTRSYTRMATGYIHAISHIYKNLSDRFPDFMPRALDWFCETYAPNFVRERKEAAELLVLNSAQQRSTENPLESPPSKLSTADHYTLTIIVPVYNRSKYLERCLQSICQIGSLDFEVLIIDDASTDYRSKEIICHYAKDKSNWATIYNDNNMGIAKAQETALRAAKGIFIALLDCDDYLNDSWLERLTFELQVHTEVDYFFSDRVDISETGDVIAEVSYGGYDKLKTNRGIEEDLFVGMVASHLKVIRRSFWLECGPCPDIYNGVQDYWLALSMSSAGASFKYLQYPLYHHRIHSESVTSSQNLSQFRKSTRLRRYFIEKKYSISVVRSNVNSQLAEAKSGDQLFSILASQCCLLSEADLQNAEILSDILEGWRHGISFYVCVSHKSSDKMKQFLEDYCAYIDYVVTDCKIFYSWFVNLVPCSFRILYVEKILP